ncbi:MULTISPECIES: HAD-IIIC family phosphatase [unclassified Haematospirillum]|uniref:HAD-IIIC family phosphatase n=1 Tax=unclassified Haematospirillum TaxID=2622088 RepID=UPI00143B1349|nr:MULTISPECIES: HAD-IIIC family phosphatase [unclassified Haematospirillum]NKD56097.1 HAD-IIIC family phosphatase [Haematospirillum sp. H4890]NKD76146.1 HAD-IIIC family phosphatase [Haematospirillum sp. H4485]NKD88838.1 HAD-IIIC family phosphatase [Haematospirillum sp. 15-248]
MTFLEAKKLLAAMRNAEKLPFLMCMSGTADQLELYLRAHAARSGLDVQVSFLPFGTLGQHLFSEATGPEVFLLLPWDLAPECDWRSGMSGTLVDVNTILDRAEQVVALLNKRKQACLAYLPAPVPPLCIAMSDNARLATELTALAVRHGATLLASDYFSLSTYFATGSPLAGGALSPVAEVLIDHLLMPQSGHYKVVATDADNTLWAGIVGEDGVEVVSAEPHGRGFRHFVYQGFLLRLKAAGILLTVVSRNDEDMVCAALNAGRMPLKNEDFVAVRAGYGAKSDHVRALAGILNLGTDSIVFIDDNPVELAEVASGVRGVRCQAFPTRDEDLPAFLDRLALLFDRSKVTTEDAERTEMYRRLMASSPPSEGIGVETFLKDLEMVLTLRDRTHDDWQRAHQLINKTNQFNLNGRRMNESQVSAVLAEGGRMFTATLEDRTGSHGEIMACLVDCNGSVQALVMSCRVFQRRVEYAFLIWLLGYWKGPTLTFAYSATARNEPIRNFLADSAFADAGEHWTLDTKAFTTAHAADISLFTIREHLT